MTDIPALVARMQRKAEYAKSMGAKAVRIDGSPDAILALCRAVEEAQRQIPADGALCLLSDYKAMRDKAEQAEARATTYAQVLKAAIADVWGARDEAAEMRRSWQQAEGAIDEAAKEVTRHELRILDLEARVAALQSQLAEWVKQNAPGGWIDDLRVKVTALGTRLAEHKAVIDELHIAIRQEQDSRTALQQALDEAQTKWRCFHCGDVFTDATKAAVHFGEDGAAALCADWAAWTSDERRHAYEDALLDIEQARAKEDVARAERDAAREALRGAHKQFERIRRKTDQPELVADICIAGMRNIKSALGQPTEPQLSSGTAASVAGDSSALPATSQE